MASLAGRVALVTGASKGIGRDLALRLAKDGAAVACCARKAAPLEELVAEMSRGGGRALALALDVREEGAAAQAVKAVEGAYGRLDILVNNAGGALRYAGFEELRDGDWSAAFDFNVLSVVRFVRAALPLLRRSDQARIVNVSSLAALEPGAYNPHYSACKAALLNLGKHLANALARDRILVNTVCPGPVHSEAWDRNLESVAAQRKITLAEARAAVDAEEGAKVPLRRIGEGADVAALVSLLASAESSWTTGACFVVDGGKLRAMH